MSKLHVFVGPTASGKTAAMYTEMMHYYGRGYKVCVIGSKMSTGKKESSLSTNQGIDLIIPHGVIVFRIDKLADLIDIKEIEKIDIICIDEAHFYTDLLSSIITMLKKWPAKVILVSGLEALVDDNNKIIPTEVLLLFPYAIKFNKLVAGCDDCTSDTDMVVPAEATLSYRTRKGSLLMPGGKDCYLSLCTTHFFKRIDKKSGT